MTFNRDPLDDFQLRDGTVLPQGLSQQELYEQFAASWRIDQSESLFDYEEGENTLNFSHLLEGKNNLIGTRNNDVLLGEAGNDILVGGNGNDTLHGGQGEDTLIGGRGNDELIGGLQADTFVFRQNSGNDTIVGFETSDFIDISSLDSITERNGIVSQNGDNTNIDLGNGNSVVLIDVNSQILSDSNFVFG